MNFDYFRSFCFNKIINIIVVIAFLIFIILVAIVASLSANFQGIDLSSCSDSSAMEKVVETIMVSANALSTKKIEFGIKRADNHEQPDIGAENKRIIEKFNGIALGSKDSKNIYLTFDVGYEGGFTDKILDILRENNVKAAFFITGQYVKTSENTIKRMIDEGHIVGNHTVHHPSLPSCSDEKIEEEIMTMHKEIYEKFNYEMKYMRPPKGEFSEKSLAYIEKLGYKTVMWSFAYDDWDNNKQGREEYGKKKILDNLHNGEIMLLHATSKDNSNILDYIIKETKKQGYEFKSLDEFV